MFVCICVCVCARHISGEWHFSFCSSLMASLAGLLRWKPRCHGNAACLCELEVFHSLSPPLSLTFCHTLSPSLSSFPFPRSSLSVCLFISDSPLHLSPSKKPDRAAADARGEVCMYMKERGADWQGRERKRERVRAKKRGVGVEFFMCSKNSWRKSEVEGHMEGCNGAVWGWDRGEFKWGKC